MKYIRLLVLFTCIASMSHLIYADIIGGTNEEVRAIAEPILDNILGGFKTDNYATYSKDFDDLLKESISEDKFKETDRKTQESIGRYQSREYLGFMAKGQMTVILWKGRFDRAEDDVLIKLVVSKRQNKYLVTGLWFQ